MSLTITGGFLKGRRLLPLNKTSIRPTTAFLRQGLFNLLGNDLEGQTFLDLFAGSGLMGFEALSRGALRACFVEQDSVRALKIEENLAVLDLKSRGQVLRRPVLKALDLLKEPFDLIFADPPYAEFDKALFLEKLLAKIKSSPALGPHSRVFVEMPAVLKKQVEKLPFPGFQLKELRQYGSSLLTGFVSV
jgi:16S rRNA (guanine966-N2)-methyltransferase